MARVLIIGAGGVGSVVVHKCCQVPEVFSEIMLASRTKAKCDAIAAKVTDHGISHPGLANLPSGKRSQGAGDARHRPAMCTDVHEQADNTADSVPCDRLPAKVSRPIRTARVDADKVPELVALMREFRPELCINVALPYQDLTIMDACLECGVNYLDTANYEPPDEAKFEYKWQWAYREKFRKAGLMALLGSGFDPGVTNVFCAYAQKHLYDSIRTVDILDCNAGDHGHPFATNFNPEINIREITQNGRYWEKGEWIETGPLEKRIDFDYPVAGVKPSYLLYHEEMESLVKNIKGLERIRFWMTFSDNYLKHLEVLQNVGMTSIEPIEFEGRQIVPVRFLQALLPDPASLAANYKGKTVIGCVFDGEKEGRTVKKYIYNICDHHECYKEVGSQAISYTTGVPAMIGAMLILQGKWRGEGVFNMEELDPDPFMEALNKHGLPWTISDFHGSI